MSIPNDFIWGAATSAYQIEGAAYQDGKGLSVWDMMCRRPNAVSGNHNGDVACDHYQKYKEDIALMKSLGIKGYRFSLSWPRILPDGVGAVNQKGLDFYSRLVDELLANGITPYVTLFHWDFPYELYCRGGWLHENSSNWFADYTKVVMEHLSDRVQNWITLNEPQCYMQFGHLEGIHAPGDKMIFSQVLMAGHNTLLAHGKSFKMIQSYAKSRPNIGYAPVGFVCVPERNTPEDILAAEKATFKCELSNVLNNTWWMDPVLLGTYPEDGLKLYEQYLPKIGPEDMSIIQTDIDFLGLNIYHGTVVGESSLSNTMHHFPLTSFGWPVVPESLYWGPKFFYNRYKKPIMITENGMANTEWPSLDGAVHDPQRIDFMTRYLRELRTVIEEGIPVKGYFHWSLMDNFEWAQGFSKRFGLIYVDFHNQKRILKDSAYWYRNLITSNGGALFA